MSKYPDHIIAARQKGLVLAITLLLLMVITVIGVSSMSASTIQLNLSRNSHLQHGSFQNAESTLRLAEVAWDQKLSRCLNDISDCAEDITPPIVDHVHSIDWDSAAGVNSTPYGKYVVEYLGSRPVPGEGAMFIRLYRLTARGESPDSSARTVLQSIYRKCTKSDGATCHNNGEK